MESELVVLEKLGPEAKWLRSLLIDIPLYTNSIASICMHCDCQVAIARAKNKSYNGKSRHIRWRHNIVRQLIDNGVMSLDFVRSKRNLANPLTKPLVRRLVSETLRGIGPIPKLCLYGQCPTSMMGDSTQRVKWVEVICGPYGHFQLLCILLSH